MCRGLCSESISSTFDKNTRYSTIYCLFAISQRKRLESIEVKRTSPATKYTVFFFFIVCEFFEIDNSGIWWLQASDFFFLLLCAFFLRVRHCIRRRSSSIRKTRGGEKFSWKCFHVNTHSSMLCWLTKIAKPSASHIQTLARTHTSHTLLAYGARYLNQPFDIIMANEDVWMTHVTVAAEFFTVFFSSHFLFPFLTSSLAAFAVDTWPYGLTHFIEHILSARRESRILFLCGKYVMHEANNSRNQVWVIHLPIHFFVCLMKFVYFLHSLLFYFRLNCCCWRQNIRFLVLFCTRAIPSRRICSVRRACVCVVCSVYLVVVWRVSIQLPTSNMINQYGQRSMLMCRFMLCGDRNRRLTAVCVVCVRSVQTEWIIQMNNIVSKINRPLAGGLPDPVFHRISISFDTKSHLSLIRRLLSFTELQFFFSLLWNEWVRRNLFTPQDVTRPSSQIPMRKSTHIQNSWAVYFHCLFSGEF